MILRADTCEAMLNETDINHCGVAGYAQPRVIKPHAVSTLNHAALGQPTLSGNTVEKKADNADSLVNLSHGARNRVRALARHKTSSANQRNVFLIHVTEHGSLLHGYLITL